MVLLFINEVSLCLRLPGKCHTPHLCTREVSWFFCLPMKRHCASVYQGSVMVPVSTTDVSHTWFLCLLRKCCGSCLQVKCHGLCLPVKCHAPSVYQRSVLVVVYQLSVMASVYQLSVMASVYQLSVMLPLSTNGVFWLLSTS